MNKGYSWVFSPENIKPSKQLIADVEKKLAVLVEQFKRDHVKQQPEDPRFNYIVDILQKKRGRYFYLCAKYRCPAENCIAEFFDVNFARLEYYGGASFNLAYLRHTNEWNTIYTELNLDDCLKAIKEDEWFRP